MNAKTNNDARPPVVASPPPMIRDIYAAEIIPVGQEPRRADFPDDSPSPQVSPSGSRVRRYDNNSSARQIRNPDGLREFKNALGEVRVFRQETMRHLRRAEICAWEAIHNCQGKDGARISQKKIAALAGIAMLKHVRKAIRSLACKGLLEVIAQGRYRPNGTGEHGLATTYRVYPRPEPRLVQEPLAKPKRQREKSASRKEEGIIERRKPK